MAQKTVKHKASPRDFFLHLLSVVALYLSAIGLLTLFFQFVNHFFPDPVTDEFYRLDSIRRAVRWGIALLVIVFPIYSWTMVLLERIYKKDPSVKDVRVRKWLIYFTVFVTALIIIGDLVSLVLNFLEGEFTIRFFLKILAVFFVAASIFWYYLSIVREEKKSRVLQIFSYFVVVVVVTSVIGAFFVTGSPAEERVRRLDNKRVQVLEEMTFAVEVYYRDHDVIPANIDDIYANFSQYSNDLLADAGGTFEYEAVGEFEYKLCTTFERESMTTSQYREPRIISPVMEKTLDWNHSEGYTCFEREVSRYVRDEVKSLNVPPKPVSNLE